MCESNPQIARVRGCDGEDASDPVEREPIDSNTIILWMTCPRKFIPASIYKWYRLYKLFKSFPASFNLHNQRTIFLNATTVYENYVDEFNSELRKIKEKGKR